MNTMDGHKGKIIKSKSSNTALVRKVERRNNKSKSNAQIEHNSAKVVKKRGVYVENPPINMSISAQGTSIPKEKKAAAPPPRAGRKRFLSSVLTILSKSSTGTQYPDQIDPKPKVTKKKSSEQKKQNPGQKEAEMMKETDRIKIKVEPEKKKKKFRSRVLNMDREYADKFEVIQRTKEIRFTPVDSSSKEDLKWSDFPKLVKDSEEKRSDIVNNIVKEISEGRRLADSKLEKDPSTLVAEAHKNDKKLYNFFVDLLETTFTLYDVKDTRDKASSKSVASSKVTFEIDEQVAQKLKVNKPPMFDDVTQKPSRSYYNIKSDHKWNGNKIIDYYTDETSYPMSPHSRPRSKSPIRRKRLKSASFSHSRQRQSKIRSPSTQSTILPPKATNKKPNKRDLLNILKEEIAKVPTAYEEPQSIYDALRAMARNKRKCQKTLRFANVKKNTADKRDEDCMKKRKIMRPSASFRYNKKPNQKSSEFIKGKSKVAETYDVRKVAKSKVADSFERHNEPSVHSIEVYGFDYNNNAYTPKKFKSYRRKKEVSLPYHSSSSECEDCEF